MSTDVSLDLVSRVRKGWQIALPDLDTSSLEVVGRIARIESISNELLEQTLADSEVSRSEFNLLCALARAPKPLRASEITAQTMRSSAATTKLTARLEKAGFIQREKLSRDARVALFSLTEKGRGLVIEQFPTCIEQERGMLSGLTDDEFSTLASLLAKVLNTAEQSV